MSIKWLEFENLLDNKQPLAKYILFYKSLSKDYEESFIKKAAIVALQLNEDEDFYKKSIKNNIINILLYPIYILMGLLTHLTALYTFPKKVYNDYKNDKLWLAVCLAVLGFIVAVPYSLLQDTFFNDDIDDDVGFFGRLMYILYQILMPVFTLIICLLDLVFSALLWSFKSGHNMAALYITGALIASCFGFNKLLLAQYLTFMQPNLRVPIASFWFLYALAMLSVDDKNSWMVIISMVILTTTSLCLFANILLPAIIINLSMMFFITAVKFTDYQFYEDLYDCVILPEVQQVNIGNNTYQYEEGKNMDLKVK